MIQRPSTRRARVASAARSDPAPGSESRLAAELFAAQEGPHRPRLLLRGTELKQRRRDQADGHLDEFVAHGRGETGLLGGERGGEPRVEAAAAVFDGP